MSQKHICLSKQILEVGKKQSLSVSYLSKSLHEQWDISEAGAKAYLESLPGKFSKLEHKKYTLSKKEKNVDRIKGLIDLLGINGKTPQELYILDALNSLDYSSFEYK